MEPQRRVGAGLRLRRALPCSTPRASTSLLQAYVAPVSACKNRRMWGRRPTTPMTPSWMAVKYSKVRALDTTEVHWNRPGVVEDNAKPERPFSLYPRIQASHRSSPFWPRAIPKRCSLMISHSVWCTGKSLAELLSYTLGGLSFAFLRIRVP